MAQTCSSPPTLLPTPLSPQFFPLPGGHETIMPLSFLGGLCLPPNFEEAAAFYKYFGSISNLKKKKPLRRDALDKSRRPWDHRSGFYCIFPYSRKWECIQTRMWTALLYFWENKRNLAMSCEASDIHIFFWPRRLAKCQCCLQNVAVFILICKYHSCELWPFPGLGIRTGIGEVVKGDPGKGRTFWKMRTEEVSVKTFLLKMLFPPLCSFWETFKKRFGTIPASSWGFIFTLQ